jgi:hypothetical protein
MDEAETLPWIDSNLAEDFLKGVHAHQAVSGFTHGFYRYPARFSPLFVRASVDSSKPAINRQFKPHHFYRRPRLVEFYFVASSVRKSVWTLVRQLRGPHLSTWA